MSDPALKFSARPGRRMRGVCRWKNSRITITADGCKAFIAASNRRDCRDWTRWTPRSGDRTGTTAYLRYRRLILPFTCKGRGRTCLLGASVIDFREQQSDLD